MSSQSMERNFILQFQHPKKDHNDIIEVGLWMQEADDCMDTELLSPLEIKACTNRRLSIQVTSDTHVRYAHKLILLWQNKYDISFAITPEMVLYVVEHLIGALKWLKDNVKKADRPLHSLADNRTSETVGSIFLRMVHRIMTHTMWFGPIGLPPPKTSFRLFDYRKGKAFVCKAYDSPMTKLMGLDIKRHESVFGSINKRTPVMKVSKEVKDWFYATP